MKNSKKRNAELKGMYVHSSRESGTYKQFFEKERKENELIKNSDSLCKLIGEQKLQIEKMKSDVIKYFGEENNVLVARLLKEWEMKENV